MVERGLDPRHGLLLLACVGVKTGICALDGDTEDEDDHVRPKSLDYRRAAVLKWWRHLDAGRKPEAASLLLQLENGRSHPDAARVQRIARRAQRIARQLQQAAENAQAGPLHLLQELLTHLRDHSDFGIVEAILHHLSLNPRFPQAAHALEQFQESRKTHRPQEVREDNSKSRRMTLGQVWQLGQSAQTAAVVPDSQDAARRRSSLGAVQACQTNTSRSSRQISPGFTLKHPWKQPQLNCSS